ncbi:hypothetical protein HUG17_8880 [Dermatophagoides farinae]|uniref:Uncharacterized protein n=1 Tax=Dermatophagoides farinae TaxID=6954 RepID=A0A9D4SDG9_DERFA|nr:uncharacterized protein LOC124496692 [Dermatophagoides farinae]KAH7637776.1 hypothetical protein HUG17_8880 [Dermatophagoides farinae]
MIMFKAIVLFGIVSIISAQMIIDSKRSGSGGFVGHRIVSGGGFTGNTGLISGGGFVGHQNVPVVTSGGFVGHGSNIQSFPSNGRYFYATPMGHSSNIPSYIERRQTIMPVGSSRIMPSSISSTQFGSSIYPYKSTIATQPSSFRRFRRSIDGLPTHDRSPTVYYGIRQQNGQQQKQQSSSSSYGQSSMSGYTGSSYDYGYGSADETVPKPYQFSLQSQDDGTGSANWYQQEQSNGDGVVVGSYTIQDPITGIMRIVNYRADDDGFHAEIQSNEPGVVDSDPANASIRTIMNNVGTVNSGYSSVSGQQQQQQQQQRVDYQQYKQQSYGVPTY